MQQKYAEGPIAFLTIRKNGPPTMGTALSIWFAYWVVIAALAGGLALQVSGLNADVYFAAHLVGVVSFMAFIGGSVQMEIWMGKPWSSVLKDALDGLIYAIISALTFMWLWP